MHDILQKCYLYSGSKWYLNLSKHTRQYTYNKTEIVRIINYITFYFFSGLQILTLIILQWFDINIFRDYSLTVLYCILKFSLLMLLCELWLLQEISHCCIKGLSIATSVCKKGHLVVCENLLNQNFLNQRQSVICF